MASPPPPTTFNSWIDLYNYKRFIPGNLNTIEEKEISIFDPMTKGYLQKPERFAVNVGSHANNFILLPTTQSAVNLFHHAFTMSHLPEDPPEVFGILGSRKFSPFKQISNLDIVTNPMSSPTFATRRNKSTIPTIEQFLELSSPDDFENLEGENGEPLTDLDKLPNSHWIHPAIYSVLKGAKTIKSSDAAMTIIAVLQAGAESDGVGSPNNPVPPVSQTATSAQSLLVFLWAVAKGYSKSVLLTDPPDSDFIDEKCSSILEELDPKSDGPNPESAGGTVATNQATDPTLLAALLQNVNAMTTQTLQSVEREEKKKSMLSRLTPEAESLFTLISATDWTDRKPVMNKFTKRLLSDKDPVKAFNIVSSATRDWKGTVSERGLAQFFSTGYMATEINIQPGGFTVFMFKPKSGSNARTTKSLQQSIRSMFGDTEVDEDSVKYYASNEFYLAQTVTDLEIQLQTCIRFLDTMTANEGIASEGYTYGLKLLKKNWLMFQSLFDLDHLFGVRLGYFLDRVFQSFLSKLLSYQDESEPILAARRRLKGVQEEDIDSVLRNLEYGVTPTIVLPESLTRGNRPPIKLPPRPPTDVPVPPAPIVPDNPKKPPVTRGTLVLNNSMNLDWGIPAGKEYRLLFNPRAFPERTRNWPTYPHHQTGKLGQLCLKFQVTGKCVDTCRYSHIGAASIDRQTTDIITARLHNIYETS